MKRSDLAKATMLEDKLEKLEKQMEGLSKTKEVDVYISGNYGKVNFPKEIVSVIVNLAKIQLQNDFDETSAELEAI